MYKAMASRISVTVMYSSAVWEREDSPGPIFKDGKCISAWSESVGEPKGVRPKALALATMGWFSSMREEFRRKERAFTSPSVWGAGRPVDFFVGVVLIAAYVYGENALVRHDVVLRAGMDDRYTHFHVSQERGGLRKPVRSEPLHVLHGFVNGVFPFVACRMPRLAVGSDVQYHQPFFRQWPVACR